MLHGEVAAVRRLPGCCDGCAFLRDRPPADWGSAAPARASVSKARIDRCAGWSSTALRELPAGEIAVDREDRSTRLWEDQIQLDRLHRQPLDEDGLIEILPHGGRATSG